MRFLCLLAVIAAAWGCRTPPAPAKVQPPTAPASPAIGLPAAGTSATIGQPLPGAVTAVALPEHASESGMLGIYSLDDAPAVLQAWRPRLLAVGLGQSVTHLRLGTESNSWNRTLLLRQDGAELLDTADGVAHRLGPQGCTTGLGTAQVPCDSDMATQLQLFVAISLLASPTQGPALSVEALQVQADGVPVLRLSLPAWHLRVRIHGALHGGPLTVLSAAGSTILRMDAGTLTLEPVRGAPQAWHVTPQSATTRLVQRLPFGPEISTLTELQALAAPMIASPQLSTAGSIELRKMPGNPQPFALLVPVAAASDQRAGRAWQIVPAPVGPVLRTQTVTSDELLSSLKSLPESCAGLLLIGHPAGRPNDWLVAVRGCPQP